MDAETCSSDEMGPARVFMSDRWLSESVAGLKRNRRFTPVLASHQNFITGVVFCEQDVPAVLSSYHRIFLKKFCGGGTDAPVAIL